MRNSLPWEEMNKGQEEEISERIIISKCLIIIQKSSP